MSDRALRIFISSPGDVAEERHLTDRVIKQLDGEFANSLRLEPIFWEHEPVRATATFQEQIIRPSETDIVVCILWSRLGTRLPEGFEQRPDGTPYDSGTAFEFEDAKRAYDERGTPDLLVYRKTAHPMVSLQDPERLRQAQEQWEALRRYLQTWFVNEDGSLRAGLTEFETAAEFEEILERHLRSLILTKLQAVGVRPSEDIGVATWHSGSPFRGLAAFDFEHEPVFFGRTRAIGDIKNALVSQAAGGRVFLLVFGMSGCGKSSLVRAGVLPRITTLGVIEGVHLWRRCVLRPGDAVGGPLDGLAAALFGASALPELESLKWNSAQLAAHFEGAPGLAAQPIAQALGAAAEKEALAADARAQLVVVIDQMEELFTLERVDERQRAAFVDTLSTLAGSGIVWVIGTMRSDFYHRCAEIPELVQLTEGLGQYHLLPPSAPEIARMIRAPARAAGLCFETRPETAERLDDVLHEAAARSPEALPLLEFALDELFKQRSDGALTFAAYESLGGLEGALARRAEEVFKGLDADVQAALPTVLQRLVTVGLGEDERIAAQPAPMTDLTARTDRKALVNALLKARLLVTDRTADGTVVVRVAHEALLEAWPRVSNWLKRETKKLRLRAEIKYSYNNWKTAGENPAFLEHVGERLTKVMRAELGELDPGPRNYIEKCKAKTYWRRVIIVSISVILVILTGSALWAGMQSLTAQIEAKTQKALTLATESMSYSDELVDLGTNRELVTAFLKSTEVQQKMTSLGMDPAKLEAGIGALSDADALRYLNDLVIRMALQAVRQLPDSRSNPANHPEAAEVVGALARAVLQTHDSQHLGGSRADDFVYMARFGPFREKGDQRLVTASKDGAWVWSVSSGVRLHPLKGHESEVYWAEFSPDGQRLVTASRDETARVWDAESGEELLALRGHEDWINTASFAPGGERIVTASADRTTRIWDITSEQEPLILSGHEKVVLQANFSPDGRRVVTALSGDRKAWIWDALSGERQLALEGHTGWVRSAEFSPNGKRVVTAGADGQMRIWDANSGQLIHAFAGHGGEVRSAAFDPKGRLVVTASTDGTARIWDVGSLNDAWGDHTMRFWKGGSPELTILPHRDESGKLRRVTSAAFSPDGRRIVTTSDDGAVWLWWCRTFRNLTDLVEFAEKRTAKSGAEPQRADAFNPTD